jgi:hypothetical protein
MMNFSDKVKPFALQKQSKTDNYEWCHHQMNTQAKKPGQVVTPVH